MCRCSPGAGNAHGLRHQPQRCKGGGARNGWQEVREWKPGAASSGFRVLRLWWQSNQMGLLGAAQLATAQQGSRTCAVLQQPACRTDSCLPCAQGAGAGAPKGRHPRLSAPPPRGAATVPGGRCSSATQLGLPCCRGLHLSSAACWPTVLQQCFGPPSAINLPPLLNYRPAGDWAAGADWRQHGHRLLHPCRHRRRHEGTHACWPEPRSVRRLLFHGEPKRLLKVEALPACCAAADWPALPALTGAGNVWQHLPRCGACNEQERRSQDAGQQGVCWRQLAAGDRRRP